ncbi:hypothetical protein [Methanogenium marinum]
MIAESYLQGVSTQKVQTILCISLLHRTALSFKCIQNFKRI